jgi:Sulfatase-modifying factor enzyme 1
MVESKTGKRYSLPTEAQWEYAARGGKNSRGNTYSGSNDVNTVAWYYGNSGNKTHSVGTKQANELNIYDMSGNAWGVVIGMERNTIVVLPIILRVRSASCAEAVISSPHRPVA